MEPVIEVKEQKRSRGKKNNGDRHVESSSVE